ncbi:MAG: ribose 5-phosphate isomerase B [Planctomycetota bacterium]
MVLKVGIASDHRGVHIKSRLILALQSEGFEITDAGTDSDQPCDYPDFAVPIATRIRDGELDRGILICGTGIGMSVVANKFPGVWAAPCYDEVMVEMSRRHNNINVLCLPGDLIGERPVDDLVLMWLRTPFESGRHQNRISKISEIESAVWEHSLRTPTLPQVNSPSVKAKASDAVPSGS